MKKILIALTSVLAATLSVQAERADRHGLEAPAPVVKEQAAPQACPAAQSCPATVQSQPKAEACPVAEQACPAAKTCCPNAKPAPFTTARGKNFVAFGGKGSLTSTDDLDMLGGGALLEANLNIFKSEGDIWGVDVAVPLNYEYMSNDGNTDSHSFSFPLNLRPYYRFNPVKDWVITPYADCGVGGMYNYVKSVQSDKNLDFTWQLGLGVEISFYEDFSFTPKYTYFRIESAPFSYFQNAGAEFSWRFASNMVASVEYGHRFYQDSVSGNWGMLKVRYEF